MRRRGRGRAAEVDAAGVPVALAHALAERGQVVVHVDHVGLHGLGGQWAVADVIERDPAPSKLLGSADLSP